MTACTARFRAVVMRYSQVSAQIAAWLAWFRRRSHESRRAVSNDNNAQQINRVAGDRSSLAQDVVTTVATVGVIAAGVALLEVALIPGMVLGGAAILAPGLLPKSLTKSLSLRGLRRRLKPLLDFSPPIASRTALKASPQNLPVVKSALPVQFTIKQAIA